MNDRSHPPPLSASLDERFIELERIGEMEYWLKVFNTTPDELYAAISEVGASAAAVAMHFKSRDGSGR